MAISLSTALSPNTTVRFNRLTNPAPTRILPNQSPLWRPRHWNKTLKLSPRRPSHVIASAVSESPPSVSEDTKNLLDTVKVYDVNGNAIPISDLWKDRKAVVAFARHFGCVLCRKRADYLAAKKPKLHRPIIDFYVRVDLLASTGFSLPSFFLFSGSKSEQYRETPEESRSLTQLRNLSQDVMDASGVALVLIGPGSVEQARTFSEQTKFKGEVYADPNHSSYEALSFVSGVLVTFTPKVCLKIIQSYMEGYRQDWKLSFERDTVSRGGWQQGGIIVAGPGKSNISYIHRDKEAGDDPDIQDILKACCS
ncbi:hypothetical protein WN944_003806 [Citrus x changshan-huyou]|uniref:Thioredoxin-like protein AAED1, chloroplastic n=3 Tax=Citrus TaxID=2706 RepID=A0AAP0QIC4_9ROSI